MPSLKKGTSQNYSSGSKFIGCNISRKDIAPIWSPKYQEVIQHKEVSPNLRPPLHPKKSSINNFHEEHSTKNVAEEHKDSQRTSVVKGN